MKLMCIHAHFDDFEFVAAGTFELWRRQLGAGVDLQVVVCTDGAAGHHLHPRAQTARIRLKEQQTSARLGHYGFTLLRGPDGQTFREGAAGPTTEFCAALWQEIRAFEPDYLFCPPLPADPRMGIHPDHVTVAEAVRRIGYMINVPHAFTPEFPATGRVAVPKKTPVILHVSDGYLAQPEAYHLAVDVEPAFDHIARLSWCHQSQIREWLPWVGRHGMTPPATLDEWHGGLRARFLRRNRAYGIRSRRGFEYFAVTAWGEVPAYARLLEDFPGLSRRHSRLPELRRLLEQWS